MTTIDANSTVTRTALFGTAIRRWVLGTVLLMLSSLVLWIVGLHWLMDCESRDRRESLERVSAAGGEVTGVDAPFWRIGKLEVWPRQWPVRARPTHVRFDRAYFSTETARRAIDALRVLPGLCYITLNDCRSSEQLISATSDVATLTVLVLNGSNVSENLWTALDHRPALQFLGVLGNPVSEAEARSWQAGHPGCRVRLVDATGSRIEFGPPANDVLCELRK